MSYGEKIVSRAEKYLGKGGSHFWEAYGMEGHWCVMFGWTIFRECGLSKIFYGGGKTAYVPTIEEWLHRNCKQVKMRDARPGDICICTWSGNGYNKRNGSRDHFTIIRKKGTGSVAYTIEGNTGGIDYRKTKVMERTREARYIYAIYRPEWPVKKSAKTAKKSKTSKKSASYVVSAEKGLNVRRSHSINAKIINAIPDGRKVKGTKVNGSWVYLPAYKGWVSKDYLKKWHA